jgi:hypothetical protein
LDAAKEILTEIDGEIWQKRGSPLRDFLKHGVFEGPPPPEVIEAVCNAVGDISGKTVDNLRSRFLNEFYLPADSAPRCRSFDSSYKCLPMDYLSLAFKNIERESADDYEPKKRVAMTALKMIRLYFKAQAALTGLVGGQVVTRLFHAGFKLCGLGDVFTVLPSFEEFEAFKEADTPLIGRFAKEEGDRRAVPGPEWIPKYFKSLERSVERGEEVQRPSEEYMQGLRDDFSELIDVLKAAMPYLDSANRDQLPMPPEAVKSVEDEARAMFGLV